MLLKKWKKLLKTTEYILHNSSLLSGVKYWKKKYMHSAFKMSKNEKF